jgi:hypothetical protein
MALRSQIEFGNEKKVEKDDGSGERIMKTFSWNGTLYGDWGKTSKQLLKNRMK